MAISAPFSSAAREPVLCVAISLDLPAVFVERMAGDVEADGFLFAAEVLFGCPIGDVGKGLVGWAARRSPGVRRTSRPGR